LKRKKKSTAEYAETAELFLGKDKKTQIILWIDTPLCLSSLQDYRPEDERRGGGERRDRSWKAAQPY
jgi:hypothetical protein